MTLNNSVIKSLCVSALLLPFTHAFAESSISAHYQTCMDAVDFGSFKNSQWAACAEQELQRQDVILNAEYNKLRKTLSAEQKQSLTTAQKSWLTFRENWCKFEEVGPGAPGGIASYGFCMVELTDKQIEAIKGFQF
ncbi:lysozyme inhibitor LprI family protein [Oceanisphaera sp. W20_SRM_FM3]|uniref:lysozyme inhibitor LprI family protein n=1 Tax=Oceanisphaera sp. W20_SRM_FM3 TaxID=3240267 RepID=UPI003F9C784F